MHGRSPSGPERRIRDRDAGLRRLRRATLVALAAAGGLTAVFGELAAKAFPGRSGTATGHVARRPAAVTTRARTVATPPPLVSSGAVAQPAPPAPVQSQAPPVVVSGGT